MTGRPDAAWASSLQSFRIRRGLMNIDKASFLLLAGALAGGACVVTSSDDDDGGSTTTTSSSTGGQGGDGAGGATTSNGGSGGQGGTGGAGGSGGGACDDSVGTAADCTMVATSCFEGLSGFCDVAADYFKPALAEMATECIVALVDSGDPNTDCDAELECRDQAMAAACPEDVSVECAALVGDCATSFPIEQADCEAYLPAFTEAGKAAVVAQCGPSVEGCLLGGVYTDLLNCIDNMAPAD